MAVDPDHAKEVKELLNRFREIAVNINLTADDILKLEKLTPYDYQNFVKLVDTFNLQMKRILNFAWKKTQGD